MGDARAVGHNIYDLDGPLMRIAARSGDAPEDIGASIVTLLEHGYTFDQVWDYIAGLPETDSIVDAIDALFDGRIR